MSEHDRPNELTGGRMRRRTFVTSAAAGAAALTLPRAARAASPTKVDVVVVGGGLSGLAAAWQLLQAGRSVVVLEASDRLGGRVYNLPTGPSPLQVTEAGGEWVGKRQTRIQAVCQQLGISLFPTYAKGKTVYYNGKAHPFSPAVPVAPLGPVAQAEVVAAIGELELMAKTVPIAAPHKAKRAQRWDSQTVASFIKANTTSQRAAKLLTVATSGPIGGTPANTSLLGYLFIAQANGGPLQLVSTKASLAFRVQGGSGLVVQKIAEQVGSSRIVLSNPVRTIEQSTSGVQVTAADGSVYAASSVIVATAPPMAGRILYDPPLPSARDQLTQHTAMGWLIKCFAVYPAPFWRNKGLNGQVQSIAPPLTGVFDNSPPDGSLGCLYGLIAGNQARIWANRPAAQRQAAVLNTFRRCFGAQAASPTNYFEYDWAAQPYIRGGAAAPPPPGVLTQFPGSIRDPVGRIHWASTETATKSWGDMDGAIMAGERAAAEVLA
jgi:monoamine oxidase